MNAAIALSPRAQTDLDDIWNVTIATWGLDQAELYLRQMWPPIDAVAPPTHAWAMPYRRLRAGYRKFPSGMHVLFYRPGEEGVEIIRTLHHRMDAERHFQS